MKYKIVNKKHPEEFYSVELKDKTEVRHWIINHLDQSISWEVVEESEPYYDPATDIIFEII